MRFAFTTDQRLLAEAVRDVLAKTGPPRAARGDAWRALAEVGLLGAHIPGEHGGLGLTPLDTVLAFEETGRRAVPGPLVETAVAAPCLVGEDRLPSIASGDLVVSVSTGDSPFLLDADTADLLVVADRDGVTIAPPHALTLTERPCGDPARRLFEAGTGGTTGSAKERAAFDGAALATSAQLIGLARELNRRAVTYAGQRRQFGQEIGSFQAVKHRLADATVAVEFAAPPVHRAAYALTHRSPTASRDVSAAKIAAGRAAHRAARTALQVHGAVGYTEELDLHLWLHRVWALRAAWGDEGLHRSRLRAALLDGPGERTRLP
ncbi:MAG TPA: acyl-CoA dehydrogenase family protein [Thermomonospora sp.]|nr:acyl-CoA dehydrogenase family protein [Thermomonospora sp.]